MNISWRNLCLCCNGRRPLTEPFRPGDWFCYMCGNHNYASKWECAHTYCPTRTRKPGDWDCPRCGNFNYSRNSHCIGRRGKCSHPKVFDPEEERRKEELDAKRRKMLEDLGWPL